MHAHRGLVAVRAGAPDARGRREFSSGLLIAPGLALTARHGVARDGVALPDIEVSLAAGPRGAVRLSEPVPGTAAWLGAGGLDAALIELGDGTPPDATPARAGFAASGLGWGEPVGTRPVAVRVTGMPGFATATTGDPAEAEAARGDLVPETYAASDRYAVDVDAWPERWQDWRGVSGSAVTCADGGYLLGVVAWSDQPFAGRRLTAVPARALLADARFRGVLERHLERVPEVEPVELAPLLSRPRAAGSPGALLRADAGITTFTGRERELALLQRWRDEPAGDGPDVKALLVTGRGGEGKTRLALELLARGKRDGWAGGALRQAVSPEEATAAVPPGVPLLLVIDYAAARAGGIAALVKAVVRARPAVPVRLLLLARTTGYWWTDLAADLDEDLPGLKEAVLPLGPLLAAGSGESDPATVFAATAAALAPHLTRFTDREPGELRALAAALPVPDLSGTGYRHVLSVQMRALADLLAAADPASPATGTATDGTTRGAERVEDTLLGHEKRYRDRLAARHGLDDLRLVRDRAVAGAALFGARGATFPDASVAACGLVRAALPELHDRASRQREVATWIAGLYPPDDPEPGADTEFWGAVLPDRLAEFLALRLLAAEETTAGDGTGLLESLVVSSDPDGIARALLTLSRAAEHDPRAADWIMRLVAARPALAGPAALQVATYAERPASLRAALAELGGHDPELLGALTAAHDVLPKFSLQALETSASLTRELTHIFGTLAARNRDAYLPQLAMSLNNHAVSLAEAGRHEEALATSAQALNAYTDLAARNHDAYLPQLATSLNNHANRLAEAGRHEEALATSAQALDARRELTARNRDAYLPDLVRSLWTRGIVLAGCGRFGDAAEACAEGVTCARELPGYLGNPLINGIARALRGAYRGDPAAAADAWRRVAGEEFPGEWK